MRENDITYSVILPVVTKPSQFETVNKYACSITGKDGIISFGGIHPDTDDYTQKLDRIKEMGLLGIKLHPDYQKTFIDDQKMIKVVQYAVDLDLIVVIHSGQDIGLPDPVHCTAKRAATMLGQIKGKNPKIVLAHTGGYEDWDSPWGGQMETFDHIKRLGLTEEELELILYRNAKEILHIFV